MRRHTAIAVSRRRITIAVSLCAGLAAALPVAYLLANPWTSVQSIVDLRQNVFTREWQARDARGVWHIVPADDPRVRLAGVVRR